MHLFLQTSCTKKTTFPNLKKNTCATKHPRRSLMIFVPPRPHMVCEGDLEELVDPNELCSTWPTCLVKRSRRDLLLHPQTVGWKSPTTTPFPRLVTFEKPSQKVTSRIGLGGKSCYNYSITGFDPYMLLQKNFKHSMYI